MKDRTFFLFTTKNIKKYRQPEVVNFFLNGAKAGDKRDQLPNTVQNNLLMLT